MRYSNLKSFITNKLAGVDWNLFVFLVLFLNVKLVIKLVALLFIYLRRFDLSFKFSVKQTGIPLFYPCMIVIALINLVVFSLYSEQNYFFLFLAGIMFWLMCILATHQVLLAVRNNSIEKIHNTLFLFFILNALVSCYHLIAIILETGELNPYRYQGMYQKYFIGTGDYIKGVTFDTSTTNAILNAFGIVYFLSRKQMVMSVFCMVILLFTGSNFINLLTLLCLGWSFVFRTDRDQKSIIVVHFAMFIIFITNISPQNNNYSINVYEKIFGAKVTQRVNYARVIPIEERPDSVLDPEQKKFKFARLYLDSLVRVQALATGPGKMSVAADSPILKPVIPKANIHAPEYQHKQDSSEARFRAIALLQQVQKKMDRDTNIVLPVNRLPGKLIGFGQLFTFMRTHPSKWITGNGMGNFSSKIAFRATGLKTSGGYPERYTYINKDFENNHFSIYLNFVAKDSGYHSITNFPYSFYAQLLGEYGIAGVICFLLFYILYFAKRIKKLSYGLPVLFIMAGAFAVDYWFEQLSVVIIFELLLLLNNKEAIQNEHA